MINERQLVNDEYEANFATNTLGTYIFTKALIPILTQNSPGRVFTTSSGGMNIFKTKLDLSNFYQTLFFTRYVQCET